MNIIFLKSIIIIIFFYCFLNKKILKIPFTITDQINNSKHNLIQRLFINPKPISTFLIGSEKQKINFTIKLNNYYTCITSIIIIQATYAIKRKACINNNIYIF